MIIGTRTRFFVGPICVWVLLMCNTLVFFATSATVITDSFLHQGHEQDELVLYFDAPVHLQIKTSQQRDGKERTVIRLHHTCVRHTCVRHTRTQHDMRMQRNFLQKNDPLARLNQQRPVGYQLQYTRMHDDSVITVNYPKKTIHVTSKQLKNFHALATTIITFKRTVPLIRHTLQKPLIVVDCGHGGEQSGARGLFGLVEKNIVLNIGKKLKTCLQKRGYEVLLTRNADETVPIDARTSLANKQEATLLISLHSNYATNRQARGIETLYYADRSKALADFVHKQLVQMPIPGLVNRGLKQALVQVVYGCECPAILVELFFLSNPDDARLLQDTQIHHLIVKHLCAAIDQFLK